MSVNTWLGRQVEKHQHSPEYELEWLMLDLNEAVSSGMQRRQLSRSDLAERLGTSRAYVTKLLDGQENMTLKTLVRVANALEMKIAVQLQERGRRMRLLTTIASNSTPSAPFLARTNGGSFAQQSLAA